MTDFKDITSTVHSSEDSNGIIIHRVRDSLFAESLMSVIMGITILSVIMVIKSYIILIDVGMYAAFSTLTVPVLHTVIRRFRTDSLFTLFMLHLAIDIIFFITAVSIPGLQFGDHMANRLYLGVILIAMTGFSLLYRLKPSFSAADSEFVVFPGIIHAVIYLLYAVADKKEYAKTIVIHAIMIAVLFIITRQIAVFNTRYFHSIHKSNKPAKLLKKQNNKTVMGLIVIIAVSLVVLAVIPVETVSKLLMKGVRTFFGMFSTLIKPSEGEFVFDLKNPFEDMDLGDEAEYDPAFDIIGNILAVILTVIVIFLIINAIRILILNAPKFNRHSETEDDGNLIDTIEDLKPEKNHLITKGPDFGSGYERRIRKQFYNKTRHAMKKGLPVSAASTPGQIETVLRAEGDTGITPLRQEYEKVRYGKRNVR